MLLHDAIASVSRRVVSDGDSATHFDVTHVVGGVVHRKGGTCVTRNVAQFLRTSGCWNYGYTRPKDFKESM